MRVRDHAVDEAVMPGGGMEAGRHSGEGEDEERDQELDEDGDEEETGEVDEADDIDGQFCDNQQDPCNQLEEGACGQKPPNNGTQCQK